MRQPQLVSTQTQKAAAAGGRSNTFRSYPTSKEQNCKELI